MAAFMNELLKMNMRGIVILLTVMGFRFLLTKLRVDHKYVVGLWMMAFLFFVIPWKISLPVGFWGNTTVLEENFPALLRGSSENHRNPVNGMGDGTDLYHMDSGNNIDRNDTGNAGSDGVADNGNPADNSGTMGSSGFANGSGSASSLGTMDGSGSAGNLGIMGGSGSAGSPSIMGDPSSVGSLGMMDGSSTQLSGIAGAALPTPIRPESRNDRITDRMQRRNLITGNVTGIMAVLWLTGLCASVGYMLYSYLRLKKKLILSIPYKGHIWWAENIHMPMVFGLMRPQIYLPVNLEDENLSYVIAHEEMHIRRKDGLLKMAAYIICLIHWFNPLIWAAYLLLGSDMEKACDEEVIRNMEKEQRKEYAYVLVHIAAGGGTRRNVFVAPIGFDEGNLKSRVKNVMKYKYTLPGLGAVVIAAIIALFLLFMTEAKEPAEAQQTALNREQDGDLNGLRDYKERNHPAANDVQNGSDQKNSQPDFRQDDSSTSALPTFYVEDLDSLRVDEPFPIENFYITNRYAATNHYYIDEAGVLWGTGENVYGQLGTGTYGFREEEYHEEPVQIAEHVVSVDASENGYFCIYLTEDGELYGIGLNFGGILLGKGSETGGYMSSYQKVTRPVLLMTDVAYARTGRECIVALQTDGSAYWWGKYSSTTLSHVPYFEDFWSLEEDDANPAIMYACEPKKIMDDCVFIATGTYTGAVINEAGEMYAWGLNLFGQCGVPVTEEDDYIREPVKVMDDVKMVWMEKIAFNDPEEGSTYYADWSTHYPYNVFLLKEDNTLMAAGLNMGDKEKVTELTGDIAETETHQYGDNYVPIRAVEYLSELHMQVLKELEFGMSLEETENALTNAGQNFYRTTKERPYFTYVDGICLCARYHQYVCVFDSQNRLESILINEGGSRDGRFLCGMPLSELQEAVEIAGGELTVGLDNEYFYEDAGQDTKYSFHVYEDVLDSVWEMAMDVSQ